MIGQGWTRCGLGFPVHFITLFSIISICCARLLKSDGTSQPPHVIFIVADDLGWNDVSWHNPGILSPNLEKLAQEGIILEQSYVQPVCTPSRTAFMTGRYPFHEGMQHDVLMALEPSGVPINTTFLPQLLKTAGYDTHIVGKWHLGYCDLKYTPLYRGFDSYFGYYLGEEDYYSHNNTALYKDKGHPGYDFHIDGKTAWEYAGQYSTHILKDRATAIIEKHNASRSLFLYLPFQAVHAPVEVPQEYEDLYPNIKNATRRIFSGMVSALDEAVGNITKALKQSGLYDNSVIIFTTDNGGQVEFGGNNWPLRGNKNTLWEGGTRGAAFVHSPLLKRRSYVSYEMIHAVDWFPTILNLAGLKIPADIDGVNQWATLDLGLTSARQEFVYNIDNFTENVSAAIRVGDFKLIVGSPGTFNDWYPLPGVQEDVLYELPWFPKDNTSLLLFNLRADPLERVDLSQERPDVVQLILTRLNTYLATMVPARKPADSPAGFPENWGGAFTPGWCKAS